MRSKLKPKSIMPLAVAARLLPPVRGDKPPHRNTLARWAVKGCRSVGGERVVLDSFFLGGTRMVSEEALVLFFERLSERTTEPLPTSPQLATKSKQK